jgi:hypothetical protein
LRASVAIVEFEATSAFKCSERKLAQVNAGMPAVTPAT